jgi:23S rRNA (uracil1939-C5)-methyltransferase
MSERRGGGRRAARAGSRRGEAARVEIASIAAGGAGVGRLPDGRAVFVHRTAPGDVAEVAITESRERWARARLLRIVASSPQRRDAPCPFYARCGGCTLEHLTYEAQLAAKSRIVADALNRIGGLAVPPPEVVPSPAEFRYRNRVSFALRRLGAGRVVAGFHAIGAPDEIVDLDGGCLLPEGPIAAGWDQLRTAWGPDARRLPSGEELRLTLRTTSSGALSLIVEGGFSEGRPDELLAAVDGLSSVWHAPGGKEPRLVAGAPGLPEIWGDETLEVSGAAFLQVNRGAARLLEEHVYTVAGDMRDRNVIDAYCGVGLHARRFAREGARVTGLDLDAEAVAAAEAAAPAGARFVAGPVEVLLPGLLPADLVVLNPPRAGLAREVPEALLTSPPTRIIYVSCDPATLARDLRRLTVGFALETVRSFDLFPQTAHVETVVTVTPLPAQRSVGAGTVEPGQS